MSLAELYIVVPDSKCRTAASIAAMINNHSDKELIHVKCIGVGTWPEWLKDVPALVQNGNVLQGDNVDGESIACEYLESLLNHHEHILSLFNGNDNRNDDCMWCEEIKKLGIDFTEDIKLLKQELSKETPSNEVIQNIRENMSKKIK